MTVLSLGNISFVSLKSKHQDSRETDVFVVSSYQVYNVVD